MPASNNVSALGSVSFGWLHHHGGFLFDEPFFMDPAVRREREAEINPFVKRRFPRDPVYNIEAHLVQIEGRQRPVTLVGAIQPNLILAAALGANFVFSPDKDPDVTAAPLAQIKNIDHLTNIDWPNTWPISLFLEQVHAMRQTAPPEHAVIPPFFWDTTGRAATHGIITTAQKLIGQRIFLEMIDNPAFVHDLFAWIVDAYAELIQRFADAAGINVTALHAGDCSACMVAPDQFAEFVIPHLNELVRRVGPLRLHSCGHSDHLLDVFQDVANLAVLNVGTHTSVEKIRKRFGPMPIDLIPDTQLLTNATPDQVDRWVRRTVDHNADGPLQFQYHLDLGLREPNCQQIHKTLASLGFPTTRQEIF